MSSPTVVVSSLPSRSEPPSKRLWHQTDPRATWCFWSLICKKDVVIVPSSRLAGRSQRSEAYKCPVRSLAAPGVPLGIVGRALESSFLRV